VQHAGEGGKQEVVGRVAASQGGAEPDQRAKSICVEGENDLGRFLPGEALNLGVEVESLSLVDLQPASPQRHETRADART
jgi:hypothetical protein